MIDPIRITSSELLALEQKATADMTDNGHALLSPSGSAWSRCAGSCLGIHKYRQQSPDSVASIEGTLARFLLEVCLKLRISPIILSSAHKYPDGVIKDGTRWFTDIQANPYNSSEVLTFSKESFDVLRFCSFSYEMRQYISLVYEKVMAYVADGWTLFAECKVSLLPVVGHSQCDGNSDVILYKGTTIIVIDLKYGEAIPVYAENNRQLILYGLGAVSYLFQQIANFLGIEKIILIIAQDRIEGHEWLIWRTTYNELIIFARDTLRPASIKALYVIANGVSGDDDFNPSENACAWCNRRKSCKARHNKATQSAISAFKAADSLQSDTVEPRVPFNPDIDLIALRELMTALPFIRAWLNAAEEHAHVLCKNGNKELGLKLVKGRRHRSFEGSTELDKIKKLVKLGVPFDDAGDLKAKSPAKLEKVKLDTDVRERVKAAIKVTHGNPIVTLSSDRRVEFIPFQSAIEAFKTKDKT